MATYSDHKQIQISFHFEELNCCFIFTSKMGFSSMINGKIVWNKLMTTWFYVFQTLNFQNFHDFFNNSINKQSDLVLILVKKFMKLWNSGLRIRETMWWAAHKAFWILYHHKLSKRSKYQNRILWKTRLTTRDK